MRYGKGFFGRLFGRLNKGRRRKQDKVAKRRDRRLTVEGLEQRQLLSAAGLRITPLPPIIVSQGTPAQVVPLMSVFREANGTSARLNYSVVADSNPSLFSATPVVVMSGLLLVRPAPDALGTADLTVQAADTSGQSAECTVSVSISATGGSASLSSGSLTSGKDTSSSGLVDGSGSGSTADVSQPPTVAVNPGAVQIVTLPFGQGPGVRYAVTGDSAPSLFDSAPTIVGPDELLVRAAADAAGSAELTICRTDSSGQSTDQTLVVEFPDAASTVNSTTGGIGESRGIAQDDASTDDSSSPGSGIITTIAGGPGGGGDGGPATVATLNNPNGVAVDAAGDIFIADSGDNVVREVNAATGVITTIAGDGTAGYGGDGGLATSAELNDPEDVLVNGNTLYIADTANNVVRAVDLTTGIITTIAGNGTQGYVDNCAATSAELYTPIGLATDAAGDLFIADQNNNVVREIPAGSNQITTVAGNYDLGAGYSGDNGPDGSATQAQLQYPAYVAVNSAGTVLYIADEGNGAVREVDLTTSTITTVANGMYCPNGVVLDAADDLFIADSGNDLIHVIDHVTGQMSVVAGSGDWGTGGDGGPAADAQFEWPTGLAVDSSGDLYVTNNWGDSVREITGLISTVAGTGSANYSGDGGPAVGATLNFPYAAAVDAAGNIYIADYGNNVVREVNHATGAITTIAGNGNALYTGDGGPATAATLNGPAGIAVDAAGDVFIADSANNVVREVNAATSIITTVVGASGSGTALNCPVGLALDAAGNLYIADSDDNVVRELNVSTGQVTTIAGDGVYGDSGDGGPATSAELGNPNGVAVDAAGNVYIVDFSGFVREVVAATGEIQTIAGGGSIWDGSADGGPATAAELFAPQGIAVDPAGNVFIADSGYGTVREVLHSTGVIETVAGSYGSQGYSGDGGPGTSATLNWPGGVTVDGLGNLLILDSCDNAVREVGGVAAVNTTVSLTASSGIADSGQIVTFTATVNPPYLGGNRVSGTVDFYDGTTLLGSAAVFSDQATFSTSSLGIGVHTITAQYDGDDYHAESTSAPLQEVVVTTTVVYWDPSQTDSENAGGAGTWTTSSNCAWWYDPATGTDVPWSDGYAAVFAGTGGVVDISGTFSPAAIEVDSNNYDITDASLAIWSGGTSIYVAAGVQATIDTPISDSGNDPLTKLGTGTLILGGSNGYTGGTDVEDGTLTVGNQSALGSGSLTDNGGELNLNGYCIHVGALSGSGGLITDETSSPTTTTLYVNETSSTTYAGNINNGSNGAIMALSVSGSGTTLTLQGSNTFSGGLSADGVTVDCSGSVGVTSSQVTTSNGGQIYQNPMPLSIELGSVAGTASSDSAASTASSNSVADGELPPILTGLAGGMQNDGEVINSLPTLSGTIDGAAPGSLIAFHVSWGDGEEDTFNEVATDPSTGFGITHVYETIGDFPIELTATVGQESAELNTSASISDPTPECNVDLAGSGPSYTGTAYPNEPGQTGPFKYNWTAWDALGPSPSGTSNPFTFTVPGPPPYDVTAALTVTDAAGETWNNSFGVTNPPFTPDTPTVSIADDDPGDQVLEGTYAYFKVTLSGNMPNNGTVSCFYQTQDSAGTGNSANDPTAATSVTDYQSTYGPTLLTFTYGIDNDDQSPDYGEPDYKISSPAPGTSQWCTTADGSYSADIAVATTAKAVDQSGTTFSVLLSDPYDADSAYQGERLGDSQAEVTIVHSLSTDADNDSIAGYPDKDAEESLYKDVSPGKIIAVQKFETGTNGNPTTTPDPNTRFVPIEVTLVPGYSESLQTTGGLRIWSGPTPTAGLDLGFHVNNLTQSIYYVEAPSAGQFKVDLIGYNTNPDFSEPPYLSDEALFTAVDQQPGNCGCCNSGTQPGYTGQANVNQTFVGGVGSVTSSMLSQSANASMNVSYAGSSSVLYLAASGSAGQNMSIGNQPYLVFAGNAVLVVSPNNGIQVWDYISSGGPNNPNDSDLPWEPRQDYICDTTGTEVDVSSEEGTMTDGDFVETDPDGTVWTFNETSGQLLSESPPDSGTSTYSYNRDGSLHSVETQTGPGATQVSTYTYNAAGQVASVSVSSGGTAIDTVVYTYYGENVAYDPSGNPGELEMVTTYDGSNTDPSNPDFVDRSYYRYYTASNYNTYDPSLNDGSDSPGEIGYLKFIFNTASLERMTAAGVDYLTASDNTVGQYADQYYEYSSDGSGQVMANTVQGSGTTTYSTTPSGFADGMNTWSYEQVETQQNSDGTTTTTTTFYNYAGDAMLTAVIGGGQEQVTYNRYDNNGDVIFTAEPSAMVYFRGGDGPDGYDYAAGYYDPTCPDLMDSDGNLADSPYINPTSGLIDVNTYYPSNPSPQAMTTTPGGVAGWAYQTAVAQGFNQASIPIGQSGGPILQTSTDYIASATVNGVTCYYTNSSTQYQNEGGGGAEVTEYSYTFNGVAIASQTTMLPVVDVDHGGTAPVGATTGPASTDVYNTFGQVVWSKDANGSIDYTQYDPATGAVTEQIQDVNSRANNSDPQFVSDECLFSGLGWALPASGLNLVTTYQVDAQGRTVRTQDPDGNVTCTVYNDADQETITYPGWHYVSSSVGWQTSGPIQVSRTDPSGEYTESLTYSWTGALSTTTITQNGVPYTDPQGTESPASTYAQLQSLSRSILNAQGQTVEEDDYFNLSGISYSTASVRLGTLNTNYHASYTAYDDLGNEVRSVDANGEITRTVYDDFGRQATTWAGTNDTGATAAQPDGSGQQGTLHSEAEAPWVPDTPSGSGYSLDFDGSSNVNVQRQETDNPAGGLTVSMWVKLTSPPTGQEYLLDTHDTNSLTNGGYSLSLNADGTITWEMDIDDGVSASLTSTATVTANGNAAENHWYFICAQYNPDSNELSLGLGTLGNPGTPVSATVTGTPIWNSGDTDALLVLGNAANDNSGFVGYMSDVRLYSGMLSSAQIASLAANQEPAGTGFPIAEWRLDEGGGTTVSGSGGNGMAITSATVYDDGQAGDGNVTESVDFPVNPASANFNADTVRVTQMFYDWQDRLVATKTGALVTEQWESDGGFQVDGVSNELYFDVGDEGSNGDTTQRSITYDTLDNAGEVTAEYVYAGNGVTIDSDNGVPVQPSGNPLSETTTLYNAQGQAYQTEIEGASPAITNTFYDADGNVTATIDPQGRVAASTYDSIGRDTDDYQGQVLDTDGAGYTTPDGTPTWTFSNLSPNSARTYDLYVQTTTPLSWNWGVTGVGGTATLSSSVLDGTAPSIGGGWNLVGTVTVSSTTSGLAVTYNGTPPDQVALLQKTGHTAYDADGNVTSTTDALDNTTATAYDNLDRQTTVTAPDPQNGLGSPVTQTIYDAAGNVSATIDPMGRVTAATYDALGQETAGYSGQVITNTAPPPSYSSSPIPTWTFTNLAPSNVTPASAFYYDIYVHFTTGTPDVQPNHYSVSPTAGGGLTGSPNNSPTGPSLGAGWYLIESVSVTAATTGLVITHGISGAPDEICVLQQTSAMAYDAAGDLTATIDAVGNVTASTFNSLGQDTDDYQGQVSNGSGSSWTFSNLTPNHALSYDVYVYSGSQAPGNVTIGSTTTASPDPAAPSLGPGWYFCNTVTLGNASLATLNATYVAGSGTVNAVALLENMSHSAYDQDGEVTAKIDSLNRVIATSYDALGQDAADYQGQILTQNDPGYQSSPNPTWNFSSFSPNYQMSYDVYVYGTTDTNQDDYSLSTSAGSASFAPSNDPTAPSMGAGWLFLGTVTVPSASASGLSVSYTYQGEGAVPPTEVCVLQQTAATAYDAAGNVTATTDALGRVSATFYNEAGENVADYQGQVAQTAGSNTWTFTNLSPNSTGIYDVYYYYSTPLFGEWSLNETPVSTWGSDATAPSLGDDWYLLGTVSAATINGSTATFTFNGGTPGAVALLQNTSQTAYDLDGEKTATTDATGNVTATAYDAQGQAVAASAGLTVTTGQTGIIDGGSYSASTTIAAWTFTDLVPNYNGNFEVYVEGGVQSGYAFQNSSGATLTFTRAVNPDSSPLGSGWYDLGTVSLLSGSLISVSLPTSAGSPPTAVCLVWQTSAAAYDADGNLTQSTDADGKVTADKYDALNRETSETWYPNQGDATLGIDETNQITYSYDADGELFSTGDDSSGYTYTYNSMGQQTSVDNNGSGPTGDTGTAGVPDVLLTSTYDANGDRTSLSAAIGTTESKTADFLSQYSYDSQNRETQVKQTGQSGGDGVDLKTVTFAYNADGQTATIDRNSFSGEVDKSTYSYDGVGGLTELSQEETGGPTYADYQWTYDADSEVTSSQNSASNPVTGSYSAENVASYSYDSTGQLVSATPQDTVDAANSLTNTYDADGNATTGSAQPASVSPIAPPPANATMLFVTNTSSNSLVSGSLANAVAQINASSGTYAIELEVSGTISLTRPLTFANSSTVFVEGPGSGLTINCSSSGSSFVVDSGAKVNISGLTFTGNSSAGNGGAILNSGTLTVQSSTFAGNTASEGGAISNSGTMTVQSSTFTGNTASVGGGAIVNSGSGTMTIQSSTFSGNTAQTGAGGGAILNTGIASFTSCTFTSNSAPRGGAMFNFAMWSLPGELSLTSCTVSGNSCTVVAGQPGPQGGGIDNWGSSLTIINTIVAGNSASGSPDIYGTATTQNSLVGSAEGSNVTGSPTTGTIVGVDPNLGPLASNGAPTQTMALLPGSPILGAGIGAYQTKIGLDNEVLFDGTYSYQYDADGNCTAKYVSSNGWDPQIDSTATDITTFSYDNRNRLVLVSYSQSYGSGASYTIAYAYDMFDNLIARQVTGSGPGTQRYVYDGTTAVLAFDGSGSLTDRYLWGPGVNQLLADESYNGNTEGKNPSSAGTMFWTLGDNENTIRDVVTDAGTLAEHIAYNVFGDALPSTGAGALSYVNQTYQTTLAGFAFGYTGEYTDTVTCDQLHGVRWYDPASQRWLTQDPARADINLYRYCGNDPGNLVDPSGCAPTTLFDVTGDAAGPYVRFDITKAPLMDGSLPWGLVTNPYNNQNPVHRPWPWNAESYAISYAPAHPNAISNIVSVGDNCCNAMPQKGNKSGGHVTAYVIHLTPGEYKVTYWYHVTLSVSAPGDFSTAHITDGSGSPVLDAAINGSMGSRSFDSTLKTRTIFLFVGASGEARVFDYEPAPTTPIGGCLKNNRAIARGEFGITQISYFLPLSSAPGIPGVSPGGGSLSQSGAGSQTFNGIH